MNNKIYGLVGFAKILALVFFSAVFLKIFFVDACFIPTGSMENTLLPGDYVFVNKFLYGPKTPKFIPFTNTAIPQICFPGMRSISTGDVVVFEFPGNKDEIHSVSQEYLVKRVLACPGDYMEIRSDGIKINNRNINFKNDPAPEKTNNEYTRDIFFNEMGFKKNKFGPIRIPKAGDTLHLDYNSFPLWKVFIEREGHKVECRGLKVFLDEKESNIYIVKRDYCFVLGDNFNYSIDSRYWGFLPVENIIGNVMVVYLSMDSTGVRFQRIGKVVY